MYDSNDKELQEEIKRGCKQDIESIETEMAEGLADIKAREDKCEELQPKQAIFICIVIQGQDLKKKLR